MPRNSFDLKPPNAVQATREEMSDFNALITRLYQEKYNEYGAVKVKPPLDWNARRSGYSDTDIVDKVNKASLQLITQVHKREGLYQVVSGVASGNEFYDVWDQTRNNPNVAVQKSSFWKRIGKTDPSFYASNIPGTLFDEDSEKWTLSTLKTILDDHSVVDGVSTPYLYFGVTNSVFAIHQEDANLGSVNYLHDGSPKVWYVIQPDYNTKFEQCLKAHLIHGYANCTEFVRHKTTVVSPAFLKKYRIPFYIFEQEVREFLITFPAAYHQGFNSGINIAEAVNYATPEWIPFGLNASFCKCKSSKPIIDMGVFSNGAVNPPLRNAPRVRGLIAQNPEFNWHQIARNGIFSLNKNHKKQIKRLNTQKTRREKLIKKSKQKENRVKST